MELCDPLTGRFITDGYRDGSKRQEFVDAVALKLHEVVVAMEITAAVTASAEVFAAAREARYTMDAAHLWRLAASVCRFHRSLRYGTAFWSRIQIRFHKKDRLSDFPRRLRPDAEQTSNSKAKRLENNLRRTALSERAENRVQQQLPEVSRAGS